MRIRLIAALLVAKITILTLRLLKRGATTLPGKVALFIYPDILTHLSDKFTSIIVTGTNGKTTTSRIIGHMLQKNNIRYIHNKSGANLYSGIVSIFIDAARLNGSFDFDTALLEIDEAAFRTAAKVIKPKIIVVTNFFRDQLDRYGELHSTLSGISMGITDNPDSILILNADDSLCSSLGQNKQNPKKYFGIDSSAYNNEETISGNDAVFCIFCKEKYVYKNHVYGHLGSYECPSCGFKRPFTDVACTNILSLNQNDSEIIIQINKSNNEVYEFNTMISLPGVYNIYNSLAAVACSEGLGLDSSLLSDSLSSFKCGFGRMESFVVDDIDVRIILVKNPAGFNQVIDYLTTISDPMTLLFLINDNLADGTDISWLWDVSFEKLNTNYESINKVLTGGTRAEEIALRLKYAGFLQDNIEHSYNLSAIYEGSIKKAAVTKKLFILPTYTALMELRKELETKIGLTEFWK